MPRSPEIRLPGLKIKILHEDRALLAIDKPAGWQLAPEHAHRVENNLHALLMGSAINGDHWARSRGIRFVRYVHRLDEATSGVLIMARSKGAVSPVSRLFTDNRVAKVYLAVIPGQPRQDRWTCRLPLLPFDRDKGRVFVNRREGKPCETDFQLIATNDNSSLIACIPITGRTHQLRVHLAESARPIVGDGIYGDRAETGLGLRAIYAALPHPFTRRNIEIAAPWNEFAKRFGFDSRAIDFNPRAVTGSAPFKSATAKPHGKKVQKRKKEKEEG